MREDARSWDELSWEKLSDRTTHYFIARTIITFGVRELVVTSLEMFHLALFSVHLSAGQDFDG